MSYDIWMEIDTGGKEPASLTDTINPTYNLGPIFRHALSDSRGLYAFDKSLGRTCTNLIMTGLQRLHDEIDECRKLEPDNGWGSVQDAVTTLRSIKRWCEENPLATLRVI